MDSTTIKQLRSICELLETLKPLLEENISRLQQDVSRQEPLIQRLLESEISAQETLIPRIQESVENLQAILPVENLQAILPLKPTPPENLNAPLIVTMPNGEIIAETYGINTFIKVIEKIGIERVRSLGIIAVQNRNLPLISDYEDPEGHSQRRLGAYYIASGNHTPQKKEWLDEINNRLEIGMTVIANPRPRS